MIFKQLDYLSPSITFYYKGFLSHPSIVSGILSILSFLLILLMSLHFSLDIILRRNPTAFYFNRYVEDVEKFPLNSSSIFHFISLALDENNLVNKGVDFKSFRIIGLETYFQVYLDDKNLSNHNHWLYGFCNNESDTEGIGHLINHDYFNKCACIRKYFDSKKQRYYDTNEPEFRWPSISVENPNQNTSFYTLFLERCEEKTINLILGEGSHCKNADEINKTIGFNSGVYLYYINNYIDVLNYKNPNRKFFETIVNSIQANSYSMNHLNFNPSLIKTHHGIIFDKVKEELSHSFDRNDAFIYNNDDTIYSVYYFWLKNRMNYYERTYKRLQDIISSIGGINQFITFVAFYINKIYNHYIVLSDTEKLLNSSIYHERKRYVKKPKEMNKIKKLPTSKENKELKKQISANYGINNEKSNNKNDENAKVKDNSKTAEYFIIDSGNNNKSQIEERKTNKKKEGDNIHSSKEKNKKNFWSFILYKSSCEKKYYSLFKIYQNFRNKIISEEHLIKNHLNIYNLLRVNERKMNSKRRFSYQFKDLIKLV